MDIYTIGKLALPVVVGIMGVVAVLTLAIGLFTSLTTMCRPTNVERFSINWKKVGDLRSRSTSIPENSRSNLPCRNTSKSH
jgi:hypothetical protein